MLRVVPNVIPAEPAPSDSSITCPSERGLVPVQPHSVSATGEPPPDLQSPSDVHSAISLLHPANQLPVGESAGLPQAQSSCERRQRTQSPFGPVNRTWNVPYQYVLQDKLGSEPSTWVFNPFCESLSSS